MFSSRNMRKLGWLFFKLMWIPFIGIFVGMIGMPNGSYDWLELPSLARFSILAVGIFTTISMILLLGSMLFGAAQNRALEENGQPAKATILNIEPTGQTVNDYYVGMSFLLDVQPPNETPFQARAEKLVPMHMMGQYQIGNIVDVKFDPGSHAIAIPDQHEITQTT